MVWDAVALHTSRGIVKRPEIALVSAGAGADVVGFGVEQLPKEAVAQVIAASRNRSTCLPDVET